MKIIIKPRGSTQQNRIYFKLMIVIFQIVKKITKYTIKVTFSLRALYNPDETVLIKQLENNGIVAHIWIQRQYIKRTLQEKLKKNTIGFARYR